MHVRVPCVEVMRDIPVGEERRQSVPLNVCQLT